GMSFEQINQWNYDNRLSRAFLDNEMDPFLESDAVFTGGVSYENLMAAFDDFEDSLGRFKTFIDWE
ncbi:MAG: YbjN domain-containing protein, partial [Alphaproteobacteria bacterium]